MYYFSVWDEPIGERSEFPDISTGAGSGIIFVTVRSMVLCSTRQANVGPYFATLRLAHHNARKNIRGFSFGMVAFLRREDKRGVGVYGGTRNSGFT